MYDTTEAFLLLCFIRLLSSSNSLYLLKTIPYLGFYKAQGGSMGITQTQTQKMGVVSGYPRVLTSADFASEDLRCRMATLTAD